MIINVIKFDADVSKQSKAGKPYSCAVVMYKNDRGEIKEKNIMSFDGMYQEFCQTLKEGETYNISTIKNDKGYLDWVAVGDSASNAGPSVTGPISDGKGGLTVGRYENKDEAIRRAVCLKAAVEIVSATLGKTSDPADAAQLAIAIAPTFDGYLSGNIEEDVEDIAKGL